MVPTPLVAEFIQNSNVHIGVIHWQAYINSAPIVSNCTQILKKHSRLVSFYTPSVKNIIDQYLNAIFTRKGVGNKFTQRDVIVKVINPTTYRIKFSSGREATYNQYHLKAIIHPVQDRNDSIGATWIFS